MKVYWAGSFDDQDRIRHIAADAAKMGLKSTSRWLFEKKLSSLDEDFYPVKHAMQDVHDVERSDALVLIMPEDQTIRLSGAMFEYGYAIALGKPVVIVGERPKRNIFTFLNEEPMNERPIYHFADINSAKMFMYSHWVELL
jgi:nucleoside 2-deoxyribosyltransferase